MADKPGHYWDFRECTWVRHAAHEAVVPAPSEPVDDRLTDDADAVVADAPAG